MNGKVVGILIGILVLCFFISGCGSKNTVVGRVTMQGYLNPFQLNIQDGCAVSTDEEVASIIYDNGECVVELKTGE